jgi:maltose/moltooligosaccharide transporter
MPHSSTLWMAAGLLWILDASINISMEPFRAFVADVLPKEQHTRGYTMQSFFIGIGAVLASVFPFILLNWFGMEGTSEQGVPGYLKISFAVGALAFLSAVLYTVFTTKEYPPDDMIAFQKMKSESTGFGHLFSEIFSTLFHLPKVIKQLALVQFFSWLGLFLMWFYLTPTIAVHIFDAPNPQSEAYAQGLAWANICLGFYSVITFMFAMIMPGLAARLGKKNLHSICLCIGGVSLILLFLVHNKYALLLNMTGVGIAWTGILAMPYSIMAGTLNPKKMGLYMGIFNFFIVLPEILAALFFGWVMSHILDNNRLSAVMLGGAMMVIAAIAALFVDDNVEDFKEENEV